MRTYYLRAWHKQRKTMYFDVELHRSAAGDDWLVYNTGLLGIAGKECIVSQYIGDDDRSGQMVFVGDVMKFPVYDGTVIIDHELHVVVFEPGVGYRPFCGEDALVVGDGDVIGNIYSDPDLIKPDGKGVSDEGRPKNNQD